MSADSLKILGDALPRLPPPLVALVYDYSDVKFTDQFLHMVCRMEIEQGQTMGIIQLGGCTITASITGWSLAHHKNAIYIIQPIPRWQFIIELHHLVELLTEHTCDDWRAFDRLIGENMYPFQLPPEFGPESSEQHGKKWLPACLIALRAAVINEQLPTP